MWSVMIVAVMAALAGFYMMPSERGAVTVATLQAREQADSMGMYRQAVVAYFTANDVTGTSVSMATLKASGVLPLWSSLYTRSAIPIWTNYRDGRGVIYIYPATPAAPEMVNEVLKLSHNAMTVGIYRASDHSLYSPADGSRVALGSLGAAAIPDQAPVWLAARD